MISNSSNKEFDNLKKNIQTYGVTAPTDKSVFEIAFKRLTAMADPNTGSIEGDSFYVCDLGEVIRKHILWESLLPRIEPFYAIKSNPNPLIIKLLASLGIGFDCSSLNEMQQVLDIGVKSEKIIYANTYKQLSYIRYAAEKNISRMTFNSDDELYKIKEKYPNAELFLRIQTDSGSKTLYPLCSKFGAPLDNVDYLLQIAKNLNLNDVFDKAKEMGFNFNLLDVGGGFPGNDTNTDISFEKIASILGPLVNNLFSKDIRVIAEPGRYYAAAAYTLFTNIIGVKSTSLPWTTDNNLNSVPNESNQKYMYYLNEGIFGTFGHILMQTQNFLPKVFTRNNLMVYDQTISEPYFESSVWGQTCDPSDCLSKSICLPKLQTGD